jgi:hypothetical protein
MSQELTEAAGELLEEARRLAAMSTLLEQNLTWAHQLLRLAEVRALEGKEDDGLMHLHLDPEESARMEDLARRRGDLGGHDTSTRIVALGIQALERELEAKDLPVNSQSAPNLEMETTAYPSQEAEPPRQHPWWGSSWGGFWH